MKHYKEKVFFLPLGGVGKIGINIYLYCYKKTWIIVDLGIGFINIKLFNNAIIIPNINFLLKEINKLIVGIVITHAHEDHMGAIPYLWSKVRCPIYTTRFSALIIEKKMINCNINYNPIIEIEADYIFYIGNFKIKLISMVHSIVEMQALFIQTNTCNIFHTGDWKFEVNTYVGNKTNINAILELKKEKPLVLVGDSTNILSNIGDKSEYELNNSLYNE